MSEALKRRRVGRDYNAIERIAGSLNDRSNQKAAFQLARGGDCSIGNNPRVNGSLVCCRTGGTKRWNPICLTFAISHIKQRSLGRIEASRIEDRTLSIALEKRRVSAPAHAIVKCQLSINLPLILRIPLKEVQFAISEISGFRLGITSEITEQRVCIGEARVPSAQSRRCRDSEAVVDGGTAIAEVQSA